jgi:hypothetical protein
MISTAKFAQDYASFWNSLFPRAEALIRSVNLNYERFAPERKDEFRSDPNRRGLLNEVGFELAKLGWSGSSNVSESTRQAAYDAGAKALLEIESKANVEPLTDLEWAESEFVAERLTMFCSRWPRDEVTFAPPVRGCGFVDSRAADLSVGPVLMEVKAGDRNFRSTDLRQVLTYAALLNLETPGRVSKVCLVNPRRGVFYIAESNDLCLAAGGITAENAFSQITAFASGAFNSI